jgi:hypothetical protein
MKISSETLEIITAISRINSKAPINGAVFKQGSKIRARRYKSDMPIMYADIKEEFPKDFAVFDLPKFISLFSVLEDPELTFEDSFIMFKSGKKKAKLRYVAPHLIESDQNFFSREIKMPSVDFSCVIDKNTLKSITDASSMFQAPQIAFVGDGKNVILSTYNLKDPKSDKLEIEIGESEWEFSMIVDMGLVQFIKRDYTVNLSKRGLIEWTSDNIKYFITCSDKSKV